MTKKPPKVTAKGQNSRILPFTHEGLKVWGSSRLLDFYSDGLWWSGDALTVLTVVKSYALHKHPVGLLMA